MRQVFQNERGNSYQKLLGCKVHQVLQSKTEVYYKVRQVLQSATDCYYKVRQVLQSVTGCYYKVRQVLQSVRVITKWDVTKMIGSRIGSHIG